MWWSIGTWKKKKKNHGVPFIKSARRDLAAFLFSVVAGGLSYGKLDTVEELPVLLRACAFESSTTRGTSTKELALWLDAQQLRRTRRRMMMTIAHACEIELVITQKKLVDIV